MSASLTTHSDTETTALGTRLAKVLQAGDTLLFHGPVGAGKSALARAIIQARQGLHGEIEDVPSPTFTLIQTYDAGPDILIHADLYRLTGPDDVIELGLEDARSSSILLVEWPERWGNDTPERHLDIHIDADREAATLRHIRAEPNGGGWEAALTAFHPEQRTAVRDTFIASTDWRFAPVHSFTGDASNRRYFRLAEGTDHPAVLMDAPPENNTSTQAFIAITNLLRAENLSAPEIYSSDPEQGFLLLEDLGDDLYATLLKSDPAQEELLYTAATDVLTALRKAPTNGLPPYDQATYLREARILTEWYIPAAAAPLSAKDQANFDALIIEATNAIDQQHPSFVYRDFHAENLLWRPEREGLARVGLIDYQDALAGHPAYDLVSLLEDARRDTSPALREAMIAHSLAATGDDPAEFHRAYATLGAQRNIKILGLFTRLCRRDGKPNYLSLMPRVWDHLMNDLEHPALADLKAWIRAHTPAPTPEIQAKLAAAS